MFMYMIQFSEKYVDYNNMLYLNIKLNIFPKKNPGYIYAPAL